VPFAEPPTGEQRFRPPKPKKPWNETITANTLSPACYQVHLKLRKLSRKNKKDSLYKQEVKGKKY
ncbi:hypothetical protein COOONC_12145, partial [Cooperia oncophora]